MPDNALTTDQLIAMLAATPRRIAAAASGVAPAQLSAAPAPGEWSATDVLAHLRACADMWGGSIVAMLAEEHPTLQAVNPLTWIKRTDYRELEFAPSCAAFAAQRSELLAMLAGLPAEGWTRGATMTGAGKPLERTVLSQARRLAIHERPHIKQIERVVAVVSAAAGA